MNRRSRAQRDYRRSSIFRRERHSAELLAEQTAQVDAYLQAQGGS